MFGLFKKKERPQEQQALNLYDEVVSIARTPYFYSALSVPDDVDGRFEMISLHEILFIDRLENIGGEAVDLSQELFDQMFLDMDRSLREMGISDLAVPKHMKRMLHGFNGRAQAYKEAFVDHSKLADVIKRNIYGTLEDVNEENVASMSSYILRQYEHLKTKSLEDFEKIDTLFMKVDKNED